MCAEDVERKSENARGSDFKVVHAGLTEQHTSERVSTWALTLLLFNHNGSCHSALCLER